MVMTMMVGTMNEHVDKISLTVSREELLNRLGRLQASLIQADLEGMFALPLTDRFYFSGTAQDGVLWVPASGPACLMIRKVYERARQESPLEHVIPFKGYRQLPDLLRDLGVRKVRRMGLALDVVPAAIYFQFRQLFPEAEFVDVSQGIRTLRSYKSPYEVELIREASRILDVGLESIRDYLQEGMEEITLAALVDARMRQEGHEGNLKMRRWGYACSYLLASGESGSLPTCFESICPGPGLSPALPYGPSHKTIRRGEPIIADPVGSFNGYCADTTRTFALGTLDSDLIQAYEVTRQILQEIERSCLRPGARTGEIYDLAISLAQQSPFGEYFLGSGESRASFMGHGLGLELDEPPFLARGSTALLEEGMVVAVEPKMLFPGRGALGVENTYLITAHGAERLTHLSEDLILIDR
ncbi:MAG: aminopeptidase P family protein [Candidatus Tectomicrobia bacterium]|uniref:Aminopeptidase P family protein n=1 Tax=Tectimicrobiota bacterium TaxID=2528274 RepID=A0A932CN02_UNCTE|nr:aminopeptidase P family protein [Candidatus Tectomicrobia bacterium]